MFLPIVCALLAVAVRLPIPAHPGAEDPWLNGAYALQGIQAPGESGPARTNLLVAVPLVVLQKAGYLAARMSGEAGEAGAVAWIRSHPGIGSLYLRLLWLAAAAAAAYVASRLAQRMPWSALAGVLVALAPVGLVGSQRLEGWALASFFLLLAMLPVRRAIGVASWGIVLTLSPLGWIAVAAGFAGGPRERRVQILLSLPLWLALVPAHLLSPLVSITKIPMQIAGAGWPGVGDGPAGQTLAAVWTPGVAVLLLGLVAWLRRAPDRMAALFAVALLWIVPALLGARRTEGIGLVAPVAIIVGVRGAEEVASRARRGRRGIVVVLAVALLGSALLAAAGTVRALAGRRDRADEIGRMIDREVGNGGRLARDPDAPAVSDSIPCFTLPKSAERADAWDFAWWPGWYGDFSHLLIRAGTVEAIERDPAGRPIGAAMLQALSRHAERVGIIGDPITERSAVMLFRLRPGPPWEVADRAEAWRSVPTSPEAARFVGDLAAFLTSRERTQSAVELCRLALRWDASNPRLWNNLGANLLLMGEPQEASEAFTEGLKTNPGSVELRYGLARAYLQGKIPGRAEIELRRVLAARPSFAAAHYEMARIAALNEDWAEVVRALENYLSYEPSPPDRAAVDAALAEARRRAALRR